MGDTSRELDAAIRRIEILEERIQGLIGYIGYQAAKSGWPRFDVSDMDAVKAIRANAQVFSHKITDRIAHKDGLSNWSGSTILSVMGVQHAIQKQSPKASEEQE